MKNTTFVVIIVVIVLIGGGYLIFRNHSSSSTSTSTPLYGSTATPSVASSPTATPTPTTAAVGTTQNHAIAISNMQFANQNITIKAGDSITWTNQDSIAHTVTSDSSSGPLNSGNLNQGASYTYTFPVAGTYTYHCSYHSYMTGTVTVQ